LTITPGQSNYRPKNPHPQHIIRIQKFGTPFNIKNRPQGVSVFHFFHYLCTMSTIIVGAGVSGICLAFQMHKRNLPFKIIDFNQNHSSKVAAGIINPLVFRRMNKSWMVDEELAEAKKMYSALEVEVNSTFFRPLPFRRIFASEDESHWWNKRIAEETEFKEYLKPLVSSDDNFDITFNEYGTGRIGEAFAIDTEVFVEKAQHWLRSINALEFTTFKYDQIDFIAKQYDNEPFDQIIFCEGYQNLNNPFFNYLPIDPTKGEVLDVTINTLKTNELLNRKCWIMPQIEQYKYRIGATYQWETTDLSPTDVAKKELLIKAKSLINNEIDVIHQRTGIRPTTPDRRPIIGKHPIHNHLYILNGMGTKGYCHAPFWSLHLIEYIFEQKDLHAEVKIDRFKKKFYNYTKEQL
jgi:glycine oxidase